MACVTYVWRILDFLSFSTAYQRRTCGVTRVSCFAAVQCVYGVIAILCGVPRESLCLSISNVLAINVLVFLVNDHVFIMYEQDKRSVV